MKSFLAVILLLLSARPMKAEPLNENPIRDPNRGQISAYLQNHLSQLLMGMGDPSFQGRLRMTVRNVLQGSLESSEDLASVERITREAGENVHQVYLDHLATTIERLSLEISVDSDEGIAYLIRLASLEDRRLRRVALEALGRSSGIRTARYLDAFRRDLVRGEHSYSVPLLGAWLQEPQERANSLREPIRSQVIQELLTRLPATSNPEIRNRILWAVAPLATQSVPVANALREIVGPLEGKTTFTLQEITTLANLSPARDAIPSLQAVLAQAIRSGFRSQYNIEPILSSLAVHPVRIDSSLRVALLDLHRHWRGSRRVVQALAALAPTDPALQEALLNNIPINEPPDYRDWPIATGAIRALSPLVETESRIRNHFLAIVAAHSPPNPQPDSNGFLVNAALQALTGVASWDSATQNAILRYAGRESSTHGPNSQTLHLALRAFQASRPEALQIITRGITARDSGANSRALALESGISSIAEHPEWLEAYLRAFSSENRWERMLSLQAFARLTPLPSNIRTRVRRWILRSGPFGGPTGLNHDEFSATVALLPALLSDSANASSALDFEVIQKMLDFYTKQENSAFHVLQDSASELAYSQARRILLNLLPSIHPGDSTHTNLFRSYLEAFYRTSPEVFLSRFLALPLTAMSGANGDRHETLRTRVRILLRETSTHHPLDAVNALKWIVQNFSQSARNRIGTRHGVPLDPNPPPLLGDVLNSTVLLQVHRAVLAFRGQGSEVTRQNWSAVLQELRDHADLLDPEVRQWQTLALSPALAPGRESLPSCDRRGFFQGFLRAFRRSG